MSTPRSIHRLGPRAAGAIMRAYQRLERRDASANDAKMDLDGGPDPEVESLPGDVVGSLDNVPDPVGAHAGAKDDKEAKAEEHKQSNTLGHG